MIRLRCVTILCLLLPFCSAGNSTRGRDYPQYKLYHDLLADYVNVRPGTDWSKAVMVHISINVLQITELSSVDQTLSFVAALQMVWHDEFLMWNATEYGISDIVVPATNVWTPDFAVYNSANGAFVDGKWITERKVNIRSDGIVTWLPGGKLVTSCNINIRFFPFDQQNCSLLITSWMEGAKTVNLTLSSDKIETFAYLESSEWILKGTNAVHFEPIYEYGGLVHVMDRIDASFLLERRYASYISSLIIPMFLLSFSGTLIFALPPDSGEKISLGLTIMLGFSVFQLVLVNNLPQSSQQTPIMLDIVTIMMSINGLSVFLSVFILYLHHKRSPTKLPSWVRLVVLQVIARLVCMGRTKSRKVDVENPEKLEIEDMVMIDVDKGSSNDFNANLSHAVGLILKELKKVTRQIKTSSEEDSALEEWKEVATVLDRLFLYIYLLLFLGTLVCTILMLNMS